MGDAGRAIWLGDEGAGSGPNTKRRLDPSECREGHLRARVVGKEAGRPGRRGPSRRAQAARTRARDFVSQGLAPFALQLGDSSNLYSALVTRQEPSRGCERPAHSLAVLVVIFADVAKVSSKCLHGQRAGRRPTPPLDDHPCREERRSHPLPNCLLPISTMPGHPAIEQGAEGEGSWGGGGETKQRTPVPKTFQGPEENIKSGDVQGCCGHTGR